MERKAAAGKWKGGRRPYGYRVDKATSTLVPEAGEAAVVRLVFGLYTQDRLGAKTIARTLNDRGHRTTTGGPWSAHQVLRVLANRVYLGELTLRGITATGCHPAITEQAMFAGAQQILAARGEDHAKRAANRSDYLLTGLLRCPSCGKAMIGTRAHGRSRVYRYYTCFTRIRYDTSRCAASRMDADAVEEAVIAALASFYRHRHDLIADAIAQARASHAASADGKRAELAAVERELARTSAAPPTPTTASEPTSSAPPAPSPSATPGSSTTSASAGPTPEPTSCSSSRTCTSASSTPPPASSCAS